MLSPKNWAGFKGLVEKVDHVMGKGRSENIFELLPTPIPPIDF